MKKYDVEIRNNFTIRASTGQSGRNEFNRAATERFYWANKGDVVEIADDEYLFNIATYLPEVKDEYILNYVYPIDQAWYTYQNDLNKDTYRQEKYVFSENCYFRICLKRVDDSTIELSNQALSEMVNFYSQGEPARIKKPQLWEKEIRTICQKIGVQREANDILLLLLTDTHATLNGTWSDTSANIKELCALIRPEAIVHLGDITDGVVSRELTYEYVRGILAELRQNGLPVHVVLGNHDANYFAGNPDVLTVQEQVELYQDKVLKSPSERDKPYYYTDFNDVRCIFLHAYDNAEKHRYGFDRGQIEWLDETLQSVPSGYRALIFSHDAPLTQLDVWADKIRHEEEILAVLTKHHECILAFIHGHTHADLLYEKAPVPIISIGCAKCEAMQDHKPDNSITPERRLNTYTQELFDLLLIKPHLQKLLFFRFGAGNDRCIDKSKNR